MDSYYHPLLNSRPILAWSILVLITLTGCANESEPSPPTLLLEESTAAGSFCEHGGTSVRVGFDTNHSGSLSDDQVDEVFYICNGPPGLDGEDGQAGQDRPLSLVEVHDEPAGDNCEFGGKRIISGVDVDNSGALDSTEISSEQFLCDSSCLDGSPLQFDIDIADIPPAFYDRYSYSIPVQTDAEELAISAISATSLNDVAAEGSDLPRLDAEYDSDTENLILKLDHGIPDMEFLLFVTDGCKTAVRSIPVADITDDDTANLHFVNLVSQFDILDLNFTLTNDTVVTLPPFVPVETVSLSTGDYTFDLFTSSYVATLPQLYLQPGFSYVVYVFEDGDDFALRSASITAVNPTGDQAHLRGIHGIDGFGDVEFVVTSSGNDDVVSETIGLGETTPLQAIDSDSSAYLEIEIVDDQQTLVFSDTAGVFEEGAIVDILAARIQDTIAIYLIDHATGEWSYHIADDVGVSWNLSSAPNQAIPDNQSAGLNDSITVDECDVVAAIDIDIDITHSTPSELIVRLRPPEGSSYNLWYRTDDGTDLIGNFNDTLWPPSGFFADQAFPIHVFLADNGSGDWNLNVSDRVSGNIGILNEWQLNLTCL